MIVKYFRRSVGSFGRFTSRFVSSTSNHSLDHYDADSVVSERKQTIKPFAKNLFIGVFDKEILSFPEVLNKEEIIALDAKVEKFKEFSKDLKNGGGLRDLVTWWNQNVNFTEKDSAGTFCCSTEASRLSEEISDPAVSLLMQIHDLCINNALKKYGTLEQKEQFLSQSKGRLIAYALCEEAGGSDPSILKTVADEISPNKWVLNGEKIYVSNLSNADFFLVFCRMEMINSSPSDEEITAFLLDRNLSGVSVEEIPLTALKGCSIGKVKLNNVKLSSDHLLGAPGNGFDISVSFLNHHKVFLASSFSAQIKQLLNYTVQYLKQRKKSFLDLKDSEIIQEELAEVASVIYTIDQMRYVIAALMDSFDTDTSLESAILQAYVSEKGIQAAEKCGNLLSAKMFDPSAPFNGMIQNLKALAHSFNTTEIIKLYIAISGLQYAGVLLANEVKQQRNSLNSPMFTLKKMLNNRKHALDNPNLHLALFENLHPSLKPSAEQMEYCVLRFQYAVETMLVQHGREITKRHHICSKLSDALIDIFSMTVVLSRASYAYCTGVQHSDQEVLMARCVCHSAFERCKQSLNELVNDSFHVNDVLGLKLGESLLREGGYFFVHPLKSNIQ